MNMIVCAEMFYTSLLESEIGRRTIFIIKNKVKRMHFMHFLNYFFPLAHHDFIHNTHLFEMQKVVTIMKT